MMRAFVVLFFLGYCFAALHNETCILNPSASNCSNFMLPNSFVEEGIESVCSQINNSMPGCTVYSICQQYSYSSSQYCQSFRIYKELCEDVPMTGCEDFTSMCTSNSSVQECQLEILPIPNTTEIIKLITSICKEMNMDACSECPYAKSPYSCDLLTTYSNLCEVMSDMSQCSSWNQYCKLVPSWPICSPNTTDGDPMMRMYFHWGVEDYVLFHGWVPTTSAQYFGTLVAVAFMGFFTHVIKLLKCYCEPRWKHPTILQDEPRSFFSVPFQPRVDFERAVIQTLEVVWSFIVMLIIMNFNVGIFLTLCFGILLGNILLGRFVKQNSESSSCCSV